MINQPTKERKRIRYKVPYVKVTIKDNKAVYENNQTVYQDPKDKRQREKC